MKLLNKLFAAMLVMPMMIGFTACEEDEVSYSPATQEAGAQVYFPAAADEVVALTDGQDSVAVTLYRVATDAALAVAIESLDDSLNVFNVPDTVYFEAGDTVVTFNVTFDFAALEADVEYGVTLQLANDVTLYGNTTKHIAVKYAPWSEWEEIEGTHVYTYATAFSGDDKGVRVFTRQSLLNSDKIQYMVFLNAYTDGTNYCPMTINYDRSTGYCDVPLMFTGQYYEGGYKIFTNDVISYAGNPEKYNQETHPCFFDEETGLFTLTLYTFLDLGGWIGTEYLQLDGYTQYDYSATLSFAGHYIDATNVDHALVQVLLGADAASYKYMAVPEKVADPTELFEAIDNEAHDGEGTQSGYIAIEASEAGYYTVAVQTYDAAGKAQDQAALTFEFLPAGQEDPWESLGYCRYTDDVIWQLCCENLGNYLTYSVEILEHQDQPGRFRLKNPYGAAYPLNEGTEYPEEDVFVEINATDPTGVFIEYQSLGCDWGWGSIGFHIYSYAAAFMDQGYTLDQIKAAGYCGTYQDGVITFPVKTLLLDFGVEDMYYANMNGAFKVDMTNLTAEPQDFEFFGPDSPMAKPAKKNAKRNNYVEVDGVTAPKASVKTKFVSYSERGNATMKLNFTQIQFGK